MTPACILRQSVVNLFLKSFRLCSAFWIRTLVVFCAMSVNFKIYLEDSTCVAPRTVDGVPFDGHLFWRRLLLRRVRLNKQALAWL